MESGQILGWRQSQQDLQDVGCERKRRVKYDAKDFSLKHLAIH